MNVYPTDESLLSSALKTMEAGYYLFPESFRDTVKKAVERKDYFQRQRIFIGSYSETVCSMTIDKKKY